MDENTIDESVGKTIWRDVVTIAKNVRTVLVPINWKFSSNQQALRNWDLWGPLVRARARRKVPSPPTSPRSPMHACSAPMQAALPP
jgi:hypothetical protein